LAFAFALLLLPFLFLLLFFLLPCACLLCSLLIIILSFTFFFFRSFLRTTSSSSDIYSSHFVLPCFRLLTLRATYANVALYDWTKEQINLPFFVKLLKTCSPQPLATNLPPRWLCSVSLLGYYLCSWVYLFICKLFICLFVRFNLFIHLFIYYFFPIYFLLFVALFLIFRFFEMCLISVCVS
jgi:hypothetical protein